MPPSFENQPKINVGVAVAISILSGAPSDGNRIALYRALKYGWLFLGVANMPAEWKSLAGPVTVKQAASVALLTSSAPDQRQALLAFTSPEEVSRRNNQTDTFAMDCRSVLELVILENFSALVINPGGPWAGVPKEDAQKIMQGVW